MVAHWRRTETISRSSWVVLQCHCFKFSLRFSNGKMSKCLRKATIFNYPPHTPVVPTFFVCDFITDINCSVCCKMTHTDVWKSFFFSLFLLASPWTRSPRSWTNERKKKKQIGIISWKFAFIKFTNSKYSILNHCVNTTISFHFILTRASNSSRRFE